MSTKNTYKKKTLTICAMTCFQSIPTNHHLKKMRKTETYWRPWPSETTKTALQYASANSSVYTEQITTGGGGGAVSSRLPPRRTALPGSPSLINY